jgi:CRP-like cAMP-binding protein/Fe-S-cluster-containing hydrogenase component 2
MTPSQSKLAERVESQVLACIGCNDCLLACPVAESRSVTIAELNHAVHLPTIHQANVAQFLSACTQCKQCVPACPADLNRAEMVLYNKLKVEDAVPNHELLLQTQKSAVPSGFSLDGLAQGLASLELFKAAGFAGLRRTVQKSTLRLLGPGEELAREGEFYERLAVVLNGSLVQTSTGPRGELLYLVVLGPGSFFGEVGVLGDCPESYGAVAREASIVLEIPKLAVLRLMEQSPSFGETMDLLYARRALHSHARSPGTLGALPEAAIMELLREAHLELVPAGQTLFTQADAPRDFLLVRAGFLRALQHDGVGDRVLTYFREGDLFGLTALLYREPRHGYTAQAVGRTEVVRIPGASLGNVFARHPEVHAALSASAYEAERLARSHDVGMSPLALDVHGTSSPPGTSHPGSALHTGRPSDASGSYSGAGAHSSRASGRPSSPSAFASTRKRFDAGVLVEEGIAKGREVLVIDQNLCTGCGNCIDACERRHGTSRLQLRGLQVEHYMFPAACRHCADPACLLCSVNGIVRLPSGEIQIVEDNCIGCGACAERCPYGNINMHAVKQNKKGFWPGMLDFLARGSSPEAALEALDPKVERVAVKCDLCAGHADYACVTACPVGANFRVDPSSLVTK